MKRIIFPESSNEYIAKATEDLKASQVCEPVLSNNLNDAFLRLRDGEVDGLIAGIDVSSREVILAARDALGVAGVTQGEKKTFSSLFVADFPDGRRLIISDGATCKKPTAEQLADIVLLVKDAAGKILDAQPRIAMLSFSTMGSGGKDESIDRIRQAISLARSRDDDILIDGEMQLDAAVNERIGRKKAPESEVAGRANVLIVPDINAGNILYKSLEQFAGAHVAGPILLGFNKPVSDLSRGSTSEDIVVTAKYLSRLI